MALRTLHRYRRLRSSLLVILTVLASGCGTFDGNLQVTYRSDGTVRAAIHLEGTETLGRELTQSRFAEQLQGAGWTIDVADAGTHATVAGWVERPSHAAMLPALQAVARPDVTDAPGLFDHWRFRRADEVFITRYTLVAQLPEGGLGGADGLPAIMYMSEAGRRQGADRASRFRLMVSLPGEIIETNADHQTGGLAAWLFTFTELDQGRVLVATSRAIRWDNIALAAVMSIASGLTMLGVLLRVAGDKSARRLAPMPVGTATGGTAALQRPAEPEVQEQAVPP